MLPDLWKEKIVSTIWLTSQCTYRCVVLPDYYTLGASARKLFGLNAPTGAWCSLTIAGEAISDDIGEVSMHLQVRGAP